VACRRTDAATGADFSPELNWQKLFKTVTIKRDGAQWFVTFSCVVDVADPVTPDRPAVGIDVGLEDCATLSDETHVENPRYYRQA